MGNIDNYITSNTDAISITATSDLGRLQSKNNGEIDNDLSSAVEGREPLWGLFTELSLTAAASEPAHVNTII